DPVPSRASLVDAGSALRASDIPRCSRRGREASLIHKLEASGASAACPGPFLYPEARVLNVHGAVLALHPESHPYDRAAARGWVAGDGLVALVGRVLELHERGDAVEVHLGVDVDGRVRAIGDGAEREDRQHVGAAAGARNLDVRV